MDQIQPKVCVTDACYKNNKTYQNFRVKGVVRPPTKNALMAFILRHKIHG